MRHRGIHRGIFTLLLVVILSAPHPVHAETDYKLIKGEITGINEKTIQLDTDETLNIGDKITLVRGGKTTAVCEVVKIQGNSVIAEILEQIGEPDFDDTIMKLVDTKPAFDEKLEEALPEVESKETKQPETKSLQKEIPTPSEEEKIEKAIGLYDAGNYQEAISSLEQVVKENPSSIYSLLYLSLSYQMLALTKEDNKKAEYLRNAKDYAKTLIKIDTNDKEFTKTTWKNYSQSAYSYWVNTDEGIDEAIYALRNYLKLSSKDFVAYKDLGLTYFYKEMFKEAIEAYQTAARIKPNDPLTHFKLGQLYEGRDLNKAIFHFKKALGYDPAGENGKVGSKAKESLGILSVMKKYGLAKKSEAKVLKLGLECKKSKDTLNEYTDKSYDMYTMKPTIYQSLAVSQSTVMGFTCGGFYGAVREFIDEHTYKGESPYAGILRLKDFSERNGLSSILPPNL